MTAALTIKQRVVLGAIVFRGYEPLREDWKTLRSLKRRGLIVEKRNSGGIIAIPSQWEATEAGRNAAMLREHMEKTGGF